jgi:photosystem II stability/assembly factor-like uncharacterized protein
MQKGFLPSVLLASLVSLVALQGCKKEDSLGLDNDKVVKAPYSLYAANDEGWLVHSNDGEQYSSIFPPDGYAPGLIVTSGNNLLFLKENLHLSKNNGRNFNPVNMDVKKFPWQTMAYDFLAHKRIYITSQLYRGVAYSQDNGETWQVDSVWAPNLPPAFEVSSFSGLGNGVLFAYSNKNNVLFRKDNAGAEWRPVTMEGLFPVDGTEFYLTSNKNTLFLTDSKGLGGVWYSENEGLHWTRFQQHELPLKKHWNCAASPNGGRSFLVGTDSFGVYRADESGKMVSATVGLEKNTTVYSMTVKRNVYKNDVTRNYVYIATNIGLFRSEDNGQTWDKMTFGPFDGKYVATY